MSTWSLCSSSSSSRGTSVHSFAGIVEDGGDDDDKMLDVRHAMQQVRRNSARSKKSILNMVGRNSVNLMTIIVHLHPQPDKTLISDPDPRNENQEFRTWILLLLREVLKKL